MSYKQTLGDWGEDVAAFLLKSSGFEEITMLNDSQRNHPGGDIMASKLGQKYLFSVKARDRFMKNGKVNWGYNIYPQKVIAAAQRYGAGPAWLVVRADRRYNTYCAYWGLINEIPPSPTNPNRVYVSMRERDITSPSYRPLANNVSEEAIADIFSDKGY
jgi:hypothetical protein